MTPLEGSGASNLFAVTEALKEVLIPLQRGMRVGIGLGCWRCLRPGLSLVSVARDEVATTESRGDVMAEYGDKDGA